MLLQTQELYENASADHVAIFVRVSNAINIEDSPDCANSSEIQFNYQCSSIFPSNFDSKSLTFCQPPSGPKNGGGLFEAKSLPSRHIASLDDELARSSLPITPKLKATSIRHMALDSLDSFAMPLPFSLASQADGMVILASLHWLREPARFLAKVAEGCHDNTKPKTPPTVMVYGRSIWYLQGDWRL
ncbi:unnamed protein product [Protopolystoma xenopodis]|uniref:Uncharacterized protein n=1 Tax=Protopolystoma xenopodis TaxID=117903 RepID=A0A448XFN8_9PLAT|nr:unnamed protein product [Protopolystoma xenopodis]